MLVIDVVDVAAIHLQALEILKVWFPTWFCLHASAANVEMAVAATAVWVKVAQNDWAASRRPGVWVALRARRQLSASHAPEARVAKNRVAKAYNMVVRSAGAELLSRKSPGHEPVYMDFRHPRNWIDPVTAVFGDLLNWAKRVRLFAMNWM
jgi:hypothetical protein